MSTHLQQYFSAQYWKGLLLEFWHALGTAKFWRELVVMTVGITIGAAAVYYFLMPISVLITMLKPEIVPIISLLGIKK